MIRQSNRLTGILSRDRGAFKGGEIRLLVNEVLYLVPDVTIGGKRLKNHEHDDGQRNHSKDRMVRQSSGLLPGAVLFQEPRTM